VLQRKLQIKFGARFTESVLSFQHSLNIKRLKKNHLETQTNAQNKQKRECANKNSSSLVNFFVPLKQVKNFCYIFYLGRG
jgi:hypothetical protein